MHNSYTGIIDVSKLDYPCTRSYDGIAGEIESDGLLLLMKQTQKKYNSEVFWSML